MAKRIEDYGMIGDGETAALVARDGSIEWLCMPRFDSEACFAALLGNEDNGHWRIAPEGEIVRTERRYQDDTLILETVWETDGGGVTLIDFMPIRGEAPDVVRIVEGRWGTTTIRSTLALRFDYGQVRPLVEVRSPREVFAVAGPNAVVLRADADVTHDCGTLTSRFDVAAGERVCFTMTWYPSHGQEPEPLHPPHDLANTQRFWRDWIAKLDYDGPDRAIVARSLLTLKALVHRPTGGMVAAPTTSLPEGAGGTRNWDYRFCWLRDATFTLLAFHHAGFEEEARAWTGWLRRSLAGEPVDVRPLYTVTGHRHAEEWEAEWLAGFNGSRPVRIGNAAIDQLQLDVYGEILNTLLLACHHRQRDGDDALFRLLVKKAEDLWREPDAGFWESRGPPRHHVQSKVMCWVAFDRAATWFEQDRELARHYRDLADAVKAEVLERGFSTARNSFVRAYDDDALDAATLALPLVGFLPPDDPRIVGTVAAIERELMVGGYVLRYATEDTDDGVGGDEGAFIACSFWLADVYGLQGRHDDARQLFDRLCATANDLGLLSEEVSLSTGRLMGNFPQALSHLSLVASALSLGKTGGPARERQQR
ncbi:glycoside hydrolase family 15 protein [uncultured Sphingomonas sp.]|uniref:glycoside hydrolase family 15 protein n=1 Tax=uncultured Sphingomonas sp. TaxID=158754 RepID=UPI0025EDDFA2|nr:glycoside hydrolase family 15 protein [uncultured Sphingomonas sp.]